MFSKLIIFLVILSKYFFVIKFLEEKHTSNRSVVDPEEGPGPPLLLDQTEAWRAEKIFF